MKKTQWAVGAIMAAAMLSSCGGNDVATPDMSPKTGFAAQAFVSDAASYNPQLSVVQPFVDAWGVTIRPAGQPGHFWVLEIGRAHV